MTSLIRVTVDETLFLNTIHALLSYATLSFIISCILAKDLGLTISEVLADILPVVTRVSHAWVSKVRCAQHLFDTLNDDTKNNQ